MTHSIFIDTGLVLGIAISIAFLVQLFRQPLIISYIITGIICGPIFLNLINSSQEFFNVFAEFGVILLLFLVGLSLNFDFLKKIGKVAAIVGISQALFVSLIGAVVLLALGFDKITAFWLAISITFSSTIIIIKLLSDKRDMHTTYGRYTVGLMLMQDIIAIVIMIFLPFLASGQSIIVSAVLVLAKGVVLFTAVYFLSRYVLPTFLDRAAKDGEFLFIFTLAWCFAMAGLGELTGLSLEVGAIIAGLSLGSSVYQAEISSRIKPLRDFFIVLFFIILGSEISPNNIQEIIIPGLALSLFVIFGKPLFLYILYRLMKFTRRNSFLAALTSAQVSEFGFVLLFMASQSGYINSQAISVFTVTALITIFVSSYFIKYNVKIYDFAKPFLNYLGKDRYYSPEHATEQYDVLVFGYHRLGWKICEVLKEMKISFAVVDFDPAAAKKLDSRRIPYFFGDAADVEFLSELPFNKARMVVSTLPDSSEQIILVRHIRKINKKVLIIANLSYIKFLNDLYNAGADYIMMPHLLGGQWMADVLKNHAWNRKTLKRLCLLQKKEMKLRYTLGHD